MVRKRSGRLVVYRDMETKVGRPAWPMSRDEYLATADRVRSSISQIPVVVALFQLLLCQLWNDPLSGLVTHGGLLLAVIAYTWTSYRTQRATLGCPSCGVVPDLHALLSGGCSGCRRTLIVVPHASVGAAPPLLTFRRPNATIARSRRGAGAAERAGFENQ